MALVFALYLLLCVRVTADIRAGLADGRIQFAASVGVLMLEARIDGSVEGAKVQLNIPIRGFPEKPDGKKIRQSWPAARAVLKAADWELIALHMRAGLEDAGATAMFAGGIRAAADGRISRQSAREVFAYAFDGGEDVEGYIKRHGLEMVSDDAAYERVLSEVLAACEKDVAAYRAGNEKVFGFLVGQAMKALRGKADPKKISEMLGKMLKA